MSQGVTSRLTKHVACDRCRRQKVRCFRIEECVNACTRCQHAGTLCTTSEPKPRGRPCTALRSERRRESTVAITYPESYSSHQGGHYDHALMHNPPETLNAYPWLGWDIDHGTVLHQELSVPITHVVDESIETPGAGYHQFLPPQDMDETEIANPPPPTTIDAASTLQTDNMLVEPHSKLSRDWDNNHMQSTLSTLLGPPSLINSEAHAQMDQLHHQSHDRSSTQSTLRRFTRINEDISRHLETIGPDTLGVDSLPSACYSLIQQSPVHPLTAILNITSDFLSLLRSMSTLSCSNAGLYPREIVTETSASESSPVNAATILMMLAGRLQLVHLYDTIFRRAYTCLSALPYDKACLDHALAGLNFGSFITDSYLRMKIVVQVVEHYLEQIERLMNLPPEYSLYEQRHPFQGNLHQCTPSTLLQTVLKHASEKLNDLTSLKWHLQGVKQALQV